MTTMLVLVAVGLYVALPLLLLQLAFWAKAQFISCGWSPDAAAFSGLAAGLLPLLLLYILYRAALRVRAWHEGDSHDS